MKVLDAKGQALEAGAKVTRVPGWTMVGTYQGIVRGSARVEFVEGRPVSFRTERRWFTYRAPDLQLVEGTEKP